MWTQDLATVEEARTFVYRYYLDDQLPAILESVICDSVDNRVRCFAPLPSPSNGVHTIQMTSSNEYGESDKSSPHTFRYPAVPHAPSSLLIVK